MINFTVETTTTPVVDGDWSVLRAVLEAVPGTILLEDADEPQLLIPVDAESPMRAATFVDGLATLMGFEVVSGSIYETPIEDFEPFDNSDEEAPTSPVGQSVRGWVDGMRSVREYA